MKLHRDRLFIVTVWLASILFCARGIGSSAAPADPMKLWSGVHLGLRSWADWNAGLYARIDPARGGVWPDTILLISDQYYNVERDPITHRITSVNAGRPLTLDYLQRASQAGVHVIIRIQPSPGNFTQDSSSNHHLLLTAIDYSHGDCPNWEMNCHRSPDDIGDHIIQIHNYNVANGIVEWGFEPANEPNLEWYDNLSRQIDTTPDQAYSVVWQEMDAYFQVIYNYVKSINPSIRVLTPTMSQGQYAERVNTLALPDCPERPLDNDSTGYDEMRATYETYRDAISWHNYWRAGFELSGTCSAGAQHVSYYFPAWLQASLYPFGNTEGFITEADLLSTQQDSQQPILNKDTLNGFRTANSIQKFIYNELRSYHIAVWLLNDLTGNAEYGWHEAYEDYGPDAQYERPWFRHWWLGSEFWSPPVAPLVTMARSGDWDVVLSWEHTPSNAWYQVWRGAEPYFAPGAQGTIYTDVAAPESGITVTHTDYGVLGDPAINYYYVLRALDAASVWVDANRTGEFDFSIQPGD